MVVETSRFGGYGLELEFGGLSNTKTPKHHGGINGGVLSHEDRYKDQCQGSDRSQSSGYEGKPAHQIPTACPQPM